jgi:hypothetical protein
MGDAQADDIIAKSERNLNFAPPLGSGPSPSGACRPRSMRESLSPPLRRSSVSFVLTRNTCIRHSKELVDLCQLVIQ